MKLFYILCLVALLNITAFLAWNSSDWSSSELSTERSLLLDPSFDKIKGSVFYYLRDSWVSKEKAQLIMELIAIERPQVCVDLGSFAGSSALPIAVTLKYLNTGKVFLIDAWSNDESVKYMDSSDSNYAWWSSLNMKDIKNQCLRMIHKWALESHCSVIHASSEEAANQIKNIDFLHLDGNFSEEGSLLDVQLYLPKVKSGGYILLSNAFQEINEVRTKMESIWLLFQECELILELDAGNTVLFRKNRN